VKQDQFEIFYLTRVKIRAVAKRVKQARGGVLYLPTKIKILSTTFQLLINNIISFLKKTSYNY
jgi:hypothetical protein